VRTPPPAPAPTWEQPPTTDPPSLTDQPPPNQPNRPAALYSAVAQAVVVGVGLAVLGAQRLALRRQAGLNEQAAKPEFDEVWRGVEGCEGV
jgi:hypothetical protein